ncbi:MAG: LPXTG cell wall anchor domain-containing protein [Spirochaetales bacterium]|nr:LPXTG cell wall anchor domain-containing protein [Spirochaetales bacterium]
MIKVEKSNTIETVQENVTTGLPGNVLVILIAAGALLLGALVFFLIRKKS